MLIPLNFKAYGKLTEKTPIRKQHQKIIEMKKFGIFAAGLAMLMAAACSNGESVSPATKALAPSQSKIDSVSYMVGLNFGSFIKGYNLGELNMNEVEKGINDLVNAKGNPRDAEFTKQFRISPEMMQTIMNSFIEQRMKYVAAVNLDKENTFFAEIAKKENVQKTESGIYYIIDNPGSEEKLGLEDNLFVHYTGTLPDGTEFDGTPAEGPSANFSLTGVIEGWKEGLQLIGDGGSIKLYIPSALAYGEYGQPNAGIEPNTPLVFDVKVDSVHRAAPAAAETETK